MNHSDVSSSNNLSNTSDLLSTMQNASSILDQAERPSFPVDQQVGIVSVSFGVCFVLSIFVAALVMHSSAYTVSQPMASAGLSVRLPQYLPERHVHTVLQRLPARLIVVLLGYALPLSLCLGWMAALWSSEPDGCFVYGLGVLLVCPAVLLATYAVGLWRHRNYSVNGRVLICGVLALFLPLLLLLLLILQRPVCPARASLGQFPHTALTAITMAASMLPVASIFYLSFSSGQPFPIAEPLPPLANSFLTTFGFRTSARPLLQKVGLYLVTLALLAAYTATVYNQVEIDSVAEEGSMHHAIWTALELGTQPSRWAGVYLSTTIVFIDVEVWLYSRTGLSAKTPFITLVSMLACRLALILIVGEAYIFLVHAVMILLLGTLVGGQVTAHRFRMQTSQKNALERLVQLPHVGKFRLRNFWPLPMRRVQKTGHGRPPVRPVAGKVTQPRRVEVPAFSLHCPSSVCLGSQRSGSVLVPGSQRSGSVLVPGSQRSGSVLVPSAAPISLHQLEGDSSLEVPTPPPSPPPDAAPPRSDSEVVINVTRVSDGRSPSAYVPPPPSDLYTPASANEAGGGNKVKTLSRKQKASGVTTPEMMPLFFIILLFVASLIAAILADTSDPSCANPSITPQSCRHPRIAPLQDYHAQWVFVLAAGLGAFFLVLCWNVYIRLEFHEWSLGSVKLLILVTEIAAGGSGALLFHATSSWIVLSFSIFIPPALLLGTHGAHTWVKGRMKLVTGVRNRDLKLLLDLVGLTACIVCGVAVIRASGNPESALFLGFFAFIFILSISAAAKYYATLRVRLFVLVCLLLSIVLLVLLVVLYNMIGGQRKAEVTLAVFAYPTLLVFVLSMLLWRASYWEGSRTVYCMLTLSMLMMLVLIVTVMSISSTAIGAVFLGLWVLILLSVVLSVVWRRTTGRLAVCIATTVGALILILLSVGAAHGVGVLVFSACAWVAIGSLVAYAFGNGPPLESLRVGVLPLYAYDAEQGKVVAEHVSVAAGFIAIIVLLLWSIFTAYTELMTPVTGVAYWAAALLYIYALDAVHGSKLDVERLCEDLTPQMVAQAVHVVKHNIDERAFTESEAEIPLGTLASCATALRTITFDSRCGVEGATDYGKPAQKQLDDFFDDLQARLHQELSLLAQERTRALDALKSRRDADLPRLHLLDRQRWLLVSFAASVVAQVLLLLRMAAEYSNMQQEDAIGQMLQATKGAHRRTAAARIAAWPHAQLEMVKQMLAIPVVARHGQASCVWFDPASARMSTATNRLSEAAPVELSKPPYVDPKFTPSVALAVTPETSNTILAELGGGSIHTKWERAPRLARSQPPGQEAILFGSAELVPSSVVSAVNDVTVGGGAQASHEEPFGTALRLVLSHHAATARLRRAFGNDQRSESGEYSIQLYSIWAERWEGVTIDDMLPCASPGTIAWGDGVVLAPWHARCVRPHELWVALLHKATAKLAGSYHRLASMSVPEIVCCLTGGLLQHISLKDGASSVPSWDLMRLWLDAECLVMFEPIIAADPKGRETSTTSTHDKSPATTLARRHGSDPLPVWHAAVDAQEIEDKVHLLLLQSAAQHRGGATRGLTGDRFRQMAKRASSLSAIGTGLASPTSSAAQSPRPQRTPTTPKRDPLGDVSYVGLLDLPDKCASVYIVRAIGPWREVCLTGNLSQPCKYQLEFFGQKSPVISTNVAGDAAGDSMAGAGATDLTNAVSTGVMIAVRRTPVLASSAACAAEETADEPPPLLQPSLHLRQDQTPSDFDAIDTVPEESDESSQMAPSSVDALADFGANSSPIFFADLPHVPTSELDGAVFSIRLALAQPDDPNAPEYAGPPVHFTASLHAPQRLVVSAYWTDAERISAVRRIECGVARMIDAKALKKMRKREYRRKRALAELLDVHDRFLGHLDVLANVWRAELRELMSADVAMADGMSSGAELIDSIFPSLDTIYRMSKGLYDRLQACNSGVHALLDKSRADHSSFTDLLVREVRDALRYEWGSTPYGSLRGRETLADLVGLEVVVEVENPEDLEARFLAELSSAMALDAAWIQVRRVYPSHTSSGMPAFAVEFEIRAVTEPPDVTRTDGSATETTAADVHLRERQRCFALHRRVESLAAALCLPVAAAVSNAYQAAGDIALSSRLLSGKVTRSIDRPLGLRRIGVSGRAGRVVAVTPNTLLTDIALKDETWDAILTDLEAPGLHSAALAALEAPDATVASLAEALRGDASYSVGDAFLAFAEYFKVFSDYTSGLDAARSRVNAIKKLETGSMALARCQQNPRTRGADIHDWLARPNQHLMRQPMLLEQLLSLTESEHPSKRTLEAALLKVKDVVAAVDRTKFEHEQKMKLSAVYERMRGDFEDSLLQPHRHLVREGAMIEVRRRAPDSRRSSTTDSGEGSDAESMEHISDVRALSLKRGFLGKRANKYAILCNDSLWYCELQRGNRYRLLHTFKFSREAPHDPAPTSLVAGRSNSFWLSDGEVSVKLQPARHGGDAQSWMIDIRKALTSQEKVDAPDASDTELHFYLKAYRRRFEVDLTGPGAQVEPNSATDALRDKVPIMSLDQVGIALAAEEEAVPKDEALTMKQIGHALSLQGSESQVQWLGAM